MPKPEPSVSMAEARAGFGELVQRAALRGESTVVTRYGVAVARIAPLEAPMAKNTPKRSRRARRGP